jgi:hypothetical protein
LGVYITVRGFPGIDNVLLERGVGVIFLGLSMYLLYVTGYEWLASEDS